MLLDTKQIFNKINSIVNKNTFFFHLIDFIQYLVLYFVLSIIGLKLVFFIEQLVLDDINPKTKLYSFKIMSEILFMLALNILIYIVIVYVGKSVPSVAKSLYPHLRESPFVYFIESFIILFILVIGDVRLEHYLERMRE
jgi:hypothetical protein